MRTARAPQRLHRSVQTSHPRQERLVTIAFLDLLRAAEGSCIAPVDVVPLEPIDVTTRRLLLAQWIIALNQPFEQTPLTIASTSVCLQQPQSCWTLIVSPSEGHCQVEGGGGTLSAGVIINHSGNSVSIFSRFLSIIVMRAVAASFAVAKPALLKTCSRPF